MRVSRKPFVSLHGRARKPIVCLAAAAAAALVGSPLARAADTAETIWSGATSTDWSVAGNWGSGVPSSTNSAEFNSTFTNQPTLSGASTSQGIWLTGSLGQNVTIDAASAQTLTITGTATLNGTANAGILIDDTGNFGLAIGPNVATTISNSTSFLVDNASTLSIQGGLTITAGKALTLGGTNASGAIDISGNIAGTTAALVVNSAGTVTLSGTNAHTGGTTLTAGTLNINNASALGTGSLTLSGGIIDNTSGAPVATTNAVNWGGASFTYAGTNDLTLGAVTGQWNSSTNAITLLGGGNLVIGLLTTSQNASNNQMTVNGAGKTLTIAGFTCSGSHSTGRNWLLGGSANVDVTGQINNGTDSSVSVDYLGTGKLTLSGTNIYTGTTKITGSVAGTLQFANEAALYNDTTSSWTAANITVNGPNTLAFNVGGSGEFTTGDVTTLVTNLDRVVNSNGLRSGSFIGFDTTNAAGGSFAISDSIQNTTSTGGGAVGLTKLGSHTLVLSGANTYTGATTVNAGTLEVDGSLGNTPVTVATGATLAGSGSTGTNGVSVNGTIAPGTPASNATATKVLASGAQTWNAGGGYNWKLNADHATSQSLSSGTTDPGGAGANWDMLTMTSLALPSSGNFTINLAPVSGTGSQFDVNSTYTWTIADITNGGVAANLLAQLQVNAAPLATATNTSASSFTLGLLYDGGSGQDLVVNFAPAAAPEPTSLALLALAGGTLTLRRRRLPPYRPS